MQRCLDGWCMGSALPLVHLFAFSAYLCRPPPLMGEVHYAVSESAANVHQHSRHSGHGHGARDTPDLPVPAHEHLGHHTRSAAELAGGNGGRHGGHGHHHRSGSSGSVGGSRHGGKSSVQHLKRAGTVVRTIRTLKRKPRAAQPGGAASPGGQAAGVPAAGGAVPTGAGGEAAAEGQPLLGEEAGDMEPASSAPAALAPGGLPAAAGTDPHALPSLDEILPCMQSGGCTCCTHLPMLVRGTTPAVQSQAAAAAAGTTAATASRMRSSGRPSLSSQAVHVSGP